MPAGGSISKVYSPVTVGPVVCISRATLWVASNPGDVGGRRVVDAVSEFMGTLNLSRSAMRC